MGLDIGLRSSEVFACLIGANGAGKSTTLMTIFGVERAAQGEIQFKGEPIHHLRPEQVAASGVSQSPERRQIFPKMSTLENLEMEAFLRKDKIEVANDLEGVFELFFDFLFFFITATSVLNLITSQLKSQEQSGLPQLSKNTVKFNLH